MTRNAARPAQVAIGGALSDEHYDFSEPLTTVARLSGQVSVASSFAELYDINETLTTTSRFSDDNNSSDQVHRHSKVAGVPPPHHLGCGPQALLSKVAGVPSPHHHGCGPQSARCRETGVSPPHHLGCGPQDNLGKVAGVPPLRLLGRGPLPEASFAEFCDSCEIRTTVARFSEDNLHSASSAEPYVESDAPTTVARLSGSRLSAAGFAYRNACGATSAELYDFREIITSDGFLPGDTPHLSSSAEPKDFSEVCTTVARLSGDTPSVMKDNHASAPRGLRQVGDLHANIPLTEVRGQPVLPTSHVSHGGAGKLKICACGDRSGTGPIEHRCPSYVGSHFAPLC